MIDRRVAEAPRKEHDQTCAISSPRATFFSLQNQPQARRRVQAVAWRTVGCVTAGAPTGLVNLAHLPQNPWGRLRLKTWGAHMTPGSPQTFQSAQADFVCSLRRIHSLCKADCTRPTRIAHASDLPDYFCMT
jgi:hypothetical protein